MTNQHTDGRRYITLSASLGNNAAGKVRKAKLEGTEHIVLPCIAIMGNIVVQGMGSLGPEYVPEQVLAELPEAWDNRPVLYDHPASFDLEANSPQVLEAQRLGWMFNTQYKAVAGKSGGTSGSILTEVWINPERLAAIDAEELLARIDNAKTDPISVSVGVWLWIKEESGKTEDGTPYAYVWLRIVPNHLAILPPGVPGACSIETGCRLGGFAKKAPVASVAPTTTPIAPIDSETGNRPDGQKVLHFHRDMAILAGGESGMGTETTEGQTPNLKSGLFSRFISSLSSLFRSLEMSDVELRDRLYDALRSTEPGFDWIMRIWPESRILIYTTITQGATFWWKRGYSVVNEGTREESVVLLDDKIQVDPPNGDNLEDWKPVNQSVNLAGQSAQQPTQQSATAALSETTPPCSCKQKANHNADDDSAKSSAHIAESPITDTNQTEEGNAMAENVKPADKPAETTTTEGTPPPASAPDTTPNPSTPPATPATPSAPSAPANPASSANRAMSAEDAEREWLAKAPPSVRAMFDRHKAAEATHRANLSREILAKQKAPVYTAERLSQLDTMQLEEISTVLGIRVDFSGVSSDINIEYGEPAKPVGAWDRALKAAKEKKSA